MTQRFNPLKTACCAAALLFGCTAAWGQSFPTKPIRIVVGLSPGGGTDTITRLVAQKLSGAVNQQIIVDNLIKLRPGVKVEPRASAAPPFAAVVAHPHRREAPGEGRQERGHLVRLVGPPAGEDIGWAEIGRTVTAPRGGSGGRGGLAPVSERRVRPVPGHPLVVDDLAVLAADHLNLSSAELESLAWRREQESVIDSTITRIAMRS